MDQRSQCVVLITGASTGIGQACAEYLHLEGYRVYGTSRNIPSGMTSDTPTGFKMIKMDVSVDNSVQRGIEWLFEQEGRIDVVVNNAGFGLAGAIEDTSIEEAKSQLETNFFGAMRVARAVLPIMREQRAGHIVNVSSLAGRIGLPFQGLYSASKFALEGWSEALRLEVRSFGIQVVLIEPGDFKTAFTDRRQRTAGSLESPIYRERCDAAVSTMENDERNGANPVRVARLLEKIIENPSPRMRYTVGRFYQRAAAWAHKIVPSRLFEWGLAIAYKVD